MAKTLAKSQAGNGDQGEYLLGAKSFSESPRVDVRQDLRSHPKADLSFSGTIRDLYGSRDLVQFWGEAAGRRVEMTSISKGPGRST